METSKYLKLSSWGTALIPGTLEIDQQDLPPAKETNIRLGHQPLSLLDNSLRECHFEGPISICCGFIDRWQRCSLHKEQLADELQRQA